MDLNHRPIPNMRYSRINSGVLEQLMGHLQSLEKPMLFDEHSRLLHSAMINTKITSKTFK